MMCYQRLGGFVLTSAGESIDYNSIGCPDSLPVRVGDFNTHQTVDRFGSRASCARINSRAVSQAKETTQ